jgi:hypothetical protein
MDLKTLTLASIELTGQRLDQFLTYQRVLLEELGRTVAGEGWSGRFAFAHQHALAKAGLDVVTYEKVRAQVGDYYARATTVATVRERVAQARSSLEAARAAARPSDPADVRLLARADQELPALEDWTEFRTRYGVAALELLRSREVEVTRLHREVAVAEGCPKGLKA